MVVISHLPFRAPWALSVLVLQLLFAASAGADSAAGNQAWAGLLTAKEQQFLKAHQPLKLCVDPDWQPYEQIDEAGQHVGLAADYIELMRQRLNVAIELYPTDSWTASLKAVEERRCDMLSMARDMPSRRHYLDFTQAYISFPFVVATTHDKPYVDSFALIRQQRFAVTRGFAIIELLRAKWPDIELVEVDNIHVGLEQVRQRQVFGFIDSALAITFALQQHGLLDLKVSAQLEHQSAPAIATRNDQPLLQRIFEKGLATMTDEEHAAIYNRWVSVRYEQGFDYRLMFQLVSVAGVLLIVSLYWNRRLMASNRTAREALKDLGLARQMLEQKNQLLAQQNQKLERLASTDTLTGLDNRASLDQNLLRQVERSRCSGAPLGLMLLDIDHFKRVNDNCGHQVGDKVLVRVAQILKETLGAQPVGRWGGEEFMVIWPDATVAQMQRSAEALRQAVEQEEFAFAQPITISIGLSLLGDDCNISSLISHADCALYRAKKLGRNRVEVLLQRFAAEFDQLPH